MLTFAEIGDLFPCARKELAPLAFIQSARRRTSALSAAATSSGKAAAGRSGEDLAVRQTFFIIAEGGAENYVILNCFFNVSLEMKPVLSVRG